MAAISDTMAADVLSTEVVYDSEAALRLIDTAVSSLFRDDVRPSCASQTARFMDRLQRAVELVATIESIEATPYAIGREAETMRETLWSELLGIMSCIRQPELIS